MFCKENGTDAEYILVHKGNPDTSMYDSSCSGAWLLRKDCHSAMLWGSPNTVNAYADSTIKTWLNGDFYNSLNVTSIINQVKIPYRTQGYNGLDKSGSDGLSCKIFLLSGYEVGWTTAVTTYFPVDGAVLDYFKGLSDTDQKRRALLNGAYVNWWLRSPSTNGTDSVWTVAANSWWSNANLGTNSYGARPCFIVPLNTPIDSSNNLIPSGGGLTRVLLKSPGGNPLSGVTITGLTPVYGTSITTDSKGYAYGYGSGTATIVADTSEFLDLTASTSKSVAISQEGVNEVEIICTRSDITQITLSASRNVRFSLDVSDYDFSAIGGGYNGGNGSGWNNGEDSESSADGGKGGNAGGVVNSGGNINTGEIITVVVGGIGQNSKVGSTTTPSGASGGRGAHSDILRDNGSLTRHQTAATVGGDTGSFLYPPTSVGGAGGGGDVNALDSGAVDLNGAVGGSPGGGTGRHTLVSGGKDGKLPGSGGGGAQGVTNDKNPSGTPGSGQPGLVGFMWRYKE